MGEGLADDALLGGPVGGGETVGGAVLVDGGAADDGEDRVAVAAGVGEPLDEDHAGAFGPAGAVGVGGEGLAAAVGGQAALAAEVDEGVRGGHDGDAAGEGHVAFAAAQGLRGQVQGDQGGGAGRVDGDGRALQAEGVGDAAGGDAAGGAGAEVALQALGDGREPGQVVVVHDAGEDAGAAAADGGRVDPGAFEGLPGGFQQEPLVRVHGQGLARVDAEDVRVEVGGVVQEAALAGVRGPGAAGVGVVQRVEVPAAVGGERRDRVGGAGDELPQLLGGADAAGVAAAHGDDGDGLVGDGSDGGGGGGRGRGGLVAEEFGAQERGEGVRGGVVEDEGGGQPDAGGRAEAVAQLDGGERVEAQFLEGAAGVDCVGAGEAEDGGDLDADGGQQQPVAFGGGQRQQPLGEAVGGCGALGGGPARGGADQAAQQGGDHVGVGVAQCGQVEVHGDRGGLAGGAGGVHEGEALGGGQGGDSGAGDPLQVRVGEVAGHPAAFGPQAPGERGGGQAFGVAALGEGVEEGVGGGVVGLSGGAEGAGGGGEEDERGEVEVAGQLVQVDGRVDLRGQDVVEPLGGERFEDAVVEDSGGVEDGRQRVRGRYGGQHRGEGLAVGGVAGGEGDLGARGAQLRQQFGGACGGFAATAGQQQAADAVSGDEVAGDEPAEGAGGAGDEGGAVRVERAGFLPLGRGQSGDAAEPGHDGAALAEGELGFGGGQRGRQGTQGLLAVVQVEQDEPVGVLGLGGAQQAPQRGVRQVGHVGAGGGGDGAPGDEDEPGAGVAVVGEPGLGQFQGVVQRVADGGGQGRVGGGRRGGRRGAATGTTTACGTGPPASIAAESAARPLWTAAAGSTAANRAAAPARAPASPASASGPASSAHWPGATVVAAGRASGFHSTRNRESWKAVRAAWTWSGETGRNSSAATEATGAPVSSARSTETVSWPAGARRTRRARAPTARRVTPLQENGSLPCSVSSSREPMPTACRAASSRAGCRPNRAASACACSGRRTSAKTSSARCQAPVRPWKTGP
ncbi:hypothetical protein GCM10020254_75350 [Streptomyces goshikiensis]